jgi:hypothetical protein
LRLHPGKSNSALVALIKLTERSLAEGMERGRKRSAPFHRIFSMELRRRTGAG